MEDTVLGNEPMVTANRLLELKRGKTNYLHYIVTNDAGLSLVILECF